MEGSAWAKGQPLLKVVGSRRLDFHCFARQAIASGFADPRLGMWRAFRVTLRNHGGLPPHHVAFGKPCL